MPVKFILFIILSIIVAILAAKNGGEVEIKYYNFYFESKSTTAPLFVIIVVSMGFGFFLAWVDGWVAKMKLRSIIRRNNRIIESLDDELRTYKKPSLPEYTESDR